MFDIEKMKDIFMDFCHMRAFNLAGLRNFLYTTDWPENENAFKAFLLEILDKKIVDRKGYEALTEWEFNTDKEYLEHIFYIYDYVFPKYD